MIQIKNESDLQKLGLRLDADDPNAVVPLDSPSDTMPPTYITSEVVIQLETLVTDAVKEVERCDADDETATNTIAQIESDLQQAEDAQQKVAIDRVGAYWTLGRAIVNLESALAANKGKHSEDTPRKRAIELAGNNARYQRAKAIASHFESRTDAEQAAQWQSFNDILAEISEKKAEDRQTKGQKTPGRKPAMKKVERNVLPEASDSDAQTDDDRDATEEAEVPQATIMPEEMKAVSAFVAAVGGWTRAIYLIKEGYQKWQQNQE
jgi:hypothetical protein